MIKFIAGRPDGAVILGIGFTRQNFELLQKDMPMCLRAKDMGLECISVDEVMIYFAETDDLLVEPLVRMGLVDEKTKINFEAKLKEHLLKVTEGERNPHETIMIVENTNTKDALAAPANYPKSFICSDCTGENFAEMKCHIWAESCSRCGKRTLCRELLDGPTPGWTGKKPPKPYGTI